MDHETYMFHQTPEELCKKLIAYVPIDEGDILLEPFKGEGGFYNNFPINTVNEWCELKEGRCYTSYTGKIDWVITNFPFQLDTGSKRVNSFYYLLNYYVDKVDKGICVLANHSCWATLTPKRMSEINDKGLYLQKAVICNVKKWSGRYYFLIFTKHKNEVFPVILGTH